MLDQQYPMEHAFRGPGEGAGPLRHPRPGRDRGRRPGGVRGAVRRAAGGPPVPGLDGRPHPGAGRDRRRRVRRARRAALDRGRTRDASCCAGCRRCPGFGKQKAQIFTALLGQAARRTPRRAGRQAAGDYAEAGSTAPSPTSSTRRRWTRCAPSRRRRRRRSSRGSPLRRGSWLGNSQGACHNGDAALDVNGPCRAPQPVREVVRVLEHVPQGLR